MDSGPRVIDLGGISYADAYGVQLNHHAEVLAAREAGDPDPGRLLMLEHVPPVITITRRPEATAHLVASPEALARAGVTTADTDRGGDITYHGPGQLVVYAILDLNYYNLGLHDYMRLLEAAVIQTCGRFGVRADRDSCATGVWVGVNRDRAESEERALADPTRVCGAPTAKICAMGVRIRRWVALHGLALNVTTNLDHFGLIVPCGLAGRAVTSLLKELGDRCPAMDDVKIALAEFLVDALAVERARVLQTGRA